MSQTQLAERLGDVLGKKVDPTAITRTEKGTCPIPVSELAALAEVFDVSPERLVRRTSPELVRARDALRTAQASYERLIGVSKSMVIDFVALSSALDALRDDIPKMSTEDVSEVLNITSAYEQLKLDGNRWFGDAE